MSELHPIMFVGTGSDVGKSIMATAFCRIFLNDGYHPAPFKAQNMALNSFVTPTGGEIGRAQAVQAEAAHVECETDMNPLLLKPQSDTTSQIILNGSAIGTRTAADYFHNMGRERFFKVVCDAFSRLQRKYNPIVLEGAGSISEINLRTFDLVNLSMARYAKAKVFLVADIDRGGVFASVYGTLELLTKEEREMIKGIIINKFRGDINLFSSGKKLMEELCKIPVVGIIPYFKNIYIDEEDSVALAHKAVKSENKMLNIAVVLLPHISNFTDFNPLERHPLIHLFYSINPDELSKSDLIIIPGSKTTTADLSELRRNGMAKAILLAHEKGTPVLGICGGYQMMGIEIIDTQNVESNVQHMPGLGLLPVVTKLEKKKTTRQVNFLFKGNQISGYEIHNGHTTIVDNNAHPLFTSTDGTTDGCQNTNHCMGTYVHGLFDNAPFLNFLLQQIKKKSIPTSTFNARKFKDEQYDKLANLVRNNIDLDLIYKILINND